MHVQNHQESLKSWVLAKFDQAFEIAWSALAILIHLAFLGHLDETWSDTNLVDIEEREWSHQPSFEYLEAPVDFEISRFGIECNIPLEVNMNEIFY